MAGTKFKIIVDGQEEIVRVKPKHILKTERMGTVEASAESTYRLAWLAAGSDLSFDDWIESVDDIEPIFEGEEEEVPPTTKGSRGSRSAQG